MDVEIEAQDSRFGGSYAVAEVNGPDIKAENTFGASPVQTVRKTFTADGNRMRYTFPPHSYTMIKGSLVK
jgi:alpha-N-arabinofuranosidase